jgi:hypothetical protein
MSEEDMANDWLCTGIETENSGAVCQTRGRAERPLESTLESIVPSLLCRVGSGSAVRGPGRDRRSVRSWLARSFPTWVSGTSSRRSRPKTDRFLTMIRVVALVADRKRRPEALARPNQSTQLWQMPYWPPVEV